jgi:endonuclease III
MDDAGLRAWVDGDVMDAPRLNELHALVVAHGKLICQRRPKCAECALRSRCLTGSADSDTELGERVGDFAQNS